MRSAIRNSILLLALGLIFPGTGAIHKFYVSLTELHFNEESSRLEASLRIFPDDLDRALLEWSGVKTHLSTSLEPPEADSLVGTYLGMHFRVEADGKVIPFTFLGKEPESDVIWCYLESDPIPSPRSLKIMNSILIREFEDQVNIIQVYAGDWNRGILLTRKTTEDLLVIGD